jgi:hypothetical protein
MASLMPPIRRTVLLHMTLNAKRAPKGALFGDGSLSDFRLDFRTFISRQHENLISGESHAV